MKQFSTIDEILDFAISLEQDAVDFYKQLARNSLTPDMKQVFEQFAREEIGHKVRLTEVRDQGLYKMEPEDVPDLQIADYLVSIKPSPEMSYSDALVLAMKREKAAFKLYMDLSERAPDQDMKSLFLSLAIEESKHKLRFELEYDEYVLRDN
ncbi:MAG: rubrerythrin [Marinilabiliales bacterium]|nr:MAG: rubrerythrin [Marinilabiliales bacterium]